MPDRPVRENLSHTTVTMIQEGATAGTNMIRTYRKRKYATAKGCVVTEGA